MSQSARGAYVSVLCGWEPATSQIRVCIVLSALYATYLAYQAASTENRKMTDNYLSSVGFLSFLLATTALFDVLSIMDSADDNFSTCQMEHVSPLKEFVSSSTQLSPCSFLWFWLIPAFCMMSSIVVYLSQHVMTQFRKSIAIDGL